MKKVETLPNPNSNLRNFGRKALNFLFENSLIGSLAECIGMVPAEILEKNKTMQAGEKQLLVKKIKKVFKNSQLAENFRENPTALVGKFVIIFRPEINLKSNPEEKNYDGETCGWVIKAKEEEPITKPKFWENPNIFSLKLKGALFSNGINPHDKIFVSEEDPFLPEEN